jgi:osmotically-inducible protein OsmY
MPEDRKTMHAVEKALAGNDATKGLEHLHISAVSGVVFLDGEVDSDATRDAVIAAAKAVEGVRMVRNRLQINPEAKTGMWKEPHRHQG